MDVILCFMVNWFCNVSLQQIENVCGLEVSFLGHFFSHTLLDVSLLLSYFSVLADISLLLRWLVIRHVLLFSLPSLHFWKKSSCTVLCCFIYVLVDLFILQCISKRQCESRCMEFTLCLKKVKKSGHSYQFHFNLFRVQIKHDPSCW